MAISNNLTGPPFFTSFTVAVDDAQKDLAHHRQTLGRLLILDAVFVGLSILLWSYYPKYSAYWLLLPLGQASYGIAQTLWNIRKVKIRLISLKRLEGDLGENVRLSR